MKKNKIFLCLFFVLFIIQKNYCQVASNDLPLLKRIEWKASPNPPIKSVLRINKINPLYFTDDNGAAIYLTGSHTWSDMLDMTGPHGYQDASKDSFLDWIASYGHNFTRLWAFENDGFVFTDIGPEPYVRTGPGLTKDGKPKYDLTQFNQEYFDRLRSKVSAAKDRGIYVSIVFFGHSGNLLADTYFKKENNINGIDGDPDNDGYAIETRQLKIPAVTAIQDAYVKKVIETVNNFDNVLYEIACESDLTTTEWQYHFINLAREYELKFPKQHLIGMSSDGGYGPGDDTKRLFDSPADWIAPGWDGNKTSSYMSNPPAATGKKIIMVDTDHLWGVGGDSKWVWKTFMRGQHPSYMDPYIEDDPRATLKVSEGQFDSARVAMGQTLSLARQLNLQAMFPHNDLASTSYCLANPGKEYVVYLPEGGEATVDLTNAKGKFKVRWITPVEGKIIKTKKISGGSKITMNAPFNGDAVLHIVSKK
ncbi:MAG: hypothetical protein JST09_00680 [Bacteroidetes bacterium]|nr:hypothetical protein [Bacteroidota bacterium]